jgi:hypothetical protein
MNDSLIILITDHGGNQYKHGGTTPQEKTVFWAIHGPGIQPGSIITSNMTNMDTAAIVANALRLEYTDWDAKLPTGVFQ